MPGLTGSRLGNVRLVRRRAKGLKMRSGDVQSGISAIAKKYGEMEAVAEQARATLKALEAATGELLERADRIIARHADGEASDEVPVVRQMVQQAQKTMRAQAEMARRLDIRLQREVTTVNSVRAAVAEAQKRLDTFVDATTRELVGLARDVCDERVVLQTVSDAPSAGAFDRAVMPSLFELHTFSRGQSPDQFFQRHGATLRARTSLARSAAATEARQRQIAARREAVAGAGAPRLAIKAEPAAPPPLSAPDVKPDPALKAEP